LDPTALLDLVDEEFFFVSTIDRDDQRNVAPYCFAGGVAKQALCACIPTGYDALQRLADDGVIP